MSDLEKINLSDLDGINPALTRYGRQEPAPVLPLREEPDLLSWLETSGRLVSDQDSNDQEISTVEEEELSALMGEKEDYKAEEESSDEEPSETYIDEEDLKLLICALPTNLLKITMRKFKIDTKLKNTQTVCTEIQNHDLRTIICKTLLWILVMNKKPAHLNFVR